MDKSLQSYPVYLIFDTIPKSHGLNAHAKDISNLPKNSVASEALLQTDFLTFKSNFDVLYFFEFLFCLLG